MSDILWNIDVDKIQGEEHYHVAVSALTSASSDLDVELTLHCEYDRYPDKRAAEDLRQEAIWMLQDAGLQPGGSDE